LDSSLTLKLTTAIPSRSWSTGCLVPSRLIGVLVAEQTEDGKTFRNDRLIAVAKNAQNYRDLRSLQNMNQNLLSELVHFFESYNEMKNKKFKLIGMRGKKYARRLIEECIQRRDRNGSPS
jgi:inorganic pyrophosphatase